MATGARNISLTYYGDDFTGSTDALEALTLGGLPTMLFLEPPRPEDLATRPDIAAVGVAGVARGRSPEWMSAELPRVFRALKALGAPFNHYKTCSTFDSAPHVGSIGRAIEIGADVFGGPVPVIVGVERLKRYVMFSNLFAAASVAAAGAAEIFRIDRHPTMSRHPVTPMGEADLRLHLAGQTSRRIVGFDFTRMIGPAAVEALSSEVAGGAEIVLFDTFDAATTLAAGRLSASLAEKGQIFLAGSSGVDYALVEHLKERGVLPIKAPPSALGPTPRILAMCGSCSPVTDAQIAWAEARGFASIALDTPAIVERADDDEFRVSIVLEIVEALADHPGVIVHTARGGSDTRVEPTRAALARRGLSALDSSAVLGGFTGRVTRDVIAASGLRRVVLAGGDSSSNAVSSMGVKALEMAGPLIPGAPLCRILSDDPAIDGVEIALKGGQTGEVDAFGRVLGGR